MQVDDSQKQSIDRLSDQVAAAEDDDEELEESAAGVRDQVRPCHRDRHCGSTIGSWGLSRREMRGDSSWQPGTTWVRCLLLTGCCLRVCAPCSCLAC